MNIPDEYAQVLRDVAANKPMPDIPETNPRGTAAILTVLADDLHMVLLWNDGSGYRRLTGLSPDGAEYLKSLE